MHEIDKLTGLASGTSLTVSNETSDTNGIDAMSCGAPNVRHRRGRPPLHATEQELRAAAVAKYQELRADMSAKAAQIEAIAYVKTTFRRARGHFSPSELRRELARCSPHWSSTEKHVKYLGKDERGWHVFAESYREKPTYDLKGRWNKARKQ